MSVVSGLVLYAVLWSLVFLIAIPIRLQTQGDIGKVVPGTQAGAPEVHNLRRKAWITTAVAALLWALIAWIIIGGIITVEDIDLRGRLSEPR
jgi:predicted secreted protein